MAADVVIFLWAYTVLPGMEFRAPLRARLHGSILAAVTFEILKYVLIVVVPGYASTSPAAAIFGPVIAVLFFLHLLSQMILFIAAWIATADAGHPSDGPIRNRDQGNSRPGVPKEVS
jgi:membrane protein